jgi:hypothetical protein
MASSIVGPFVNGTKDVATAGTAVQVETGYSCRAITLIAHTDNVGNIFYGGSDVDSSTQKGLSPGQSVEIIRDPTARVPNFSSDDWYIDGATAGNGVDFIIEREG